MKRCCGTSTPALCPSRTTAPTCASSSDGRPSMISRCIEAVPSAVSESTKASVFSTLSEGSRIPEYRGRAIFCQSDVAPSASAEAVRFQR